MNLDSNSLRSAEVYWNAAAETYEQQFTGTTVGRARRYAVWQDLERAFRPGQRILELNCGTGIDAVFLAGKGVHVLGCDIAPRMIELAQELAAQAELTDPPDFRVLPTENLAALAQEGPFDGAFSNFSGLNCVDDLSQVAQDLGRLLKPRARFLICMMGRFVPWDIVWFLAHGKPRRAFLRLREDRTSYVGTPSLTIQRPTIAQITKQMEPAFRLLQWRGIGITVPPSYSEHVASRFPKLIDRLAWLDQRIGTLPLIRNMADCVLLEFERTAETGSDVTGI
jgi:SAM-dependent methyltransferase